MLGAPAAEYYNVKVGDTLKIMNKDLTGSGIMRITRTTFMVNDMVMMPLSTAQDMFQPGFGHDRTCRARSMDGDMNTLVASVKEKFPELEVITPTDLLDSLNAMMAARGRSSTASTPS